MRRCPKGKLFTPMRSMACLNSRRSFRLLDRFEIGTDQLNAKAIEGAVFGQGGPPG